MAAFGFDLTCHASLFFYTNYSLQVVLIALRSHWGHVLYAFVAIEIWLWEKKLLNTEMLIILLKKKPYWVSL